MSNELDYRKTISFGKMGIIEFSVTGTANQKVGQENNFKHFSSAKMFAERHFPEMPCVHAHIAGGRGVAMWDGDEWLVF